MTLLGSGRTHNSTVWCLPPPEEIGPDTPGPGRSLVTLIPQRHGCPTEDHHLADFPCRLCREAGGTFNVSEELDENSHIFSLKDEAGGTPFQ